MSQCNKLTVLQVKNAKPKKQRVSFADSISRRGRLTEVIKIQSLKNVLEFYDDVGHKENKVKTTCCCILF